MSYKKLSCSTLEQLPSGSQLFHYLVRLLIKAGKCRLLAFMPDLSFYIISDTVYSSYGPHTSFI